MTPIELVGSILILAILIRVALMVRGPNGMPCPSDDCPSNDEEKR